MVQMMLIATLHAYGTNSYLPMKGGKGFILTALNLRLGLPTPRLYRPLL